MNRRTRFALTFTFLAVTAVLIWNPGFQAVPLQSPATAGEKTISAEDCTAARLGTTIPITAIGEPVAGVMLAAPRWVAAAANAPAYCSIDGAMAPMDKSSYGRAINFRVVLPASWTRHAVQLGGGGMNGSIPNLTGGEAATLLQRGFATYGSDSGHQQGGGFGPPRGGAGGTAGAPPTSNGDDWTLSDEAIKNLGYMQLKKTHDAAMVLMELTAAACFTDGQIATLKLVYSRYKFATPLANNLKTFGMWVPTTDPSGSGIILNARFNGQEGAPANAQNHSHLGVLGVTGFLMKNTTANPLDYVEGGAFNARREELSGWLDSTNPDLSAFARRGGKVVVAIGTNDTLASPGSQLDYYQSVIDKMGRAAVDDFARLYVIPQTGHGLTGSSYTMDGDGHAISAKQIPSRFDRIAMLLDWVEKGTAPPKSATVTGNTGSLPLCSYPSYPKYNSGSAIDSASYTCALP